jgi:hypothetical protein
VRWLHPDRHLHRAEKVLWRLRRLQCGYDFEFGLSLSYTFGSQAERGGLTVGDVFDVLAALHTDVIGRRRGRGEPQRS